MCEEKKNTYMGWCVIQSWHENLLEMGLTLNELVQIFISPNIGKGSA